jgi:hypothetical protein
MVLMVSPSRRLGVGAVSERWRPVRHDLATYGVDLGKNGVA